MLNYRYVTRDDWGAWFLTIRGPGTYVLARGKLTPSVFVVVAASKPLV